MAIDTTLQARKWLDQYDEGKTTVAGVLALIAIAEALEHVAEVIDRGNGHEPAPEPEEER